MALTPIDNAHALQIQAGILGRKAGHAFEDTITQRINSFAYPVEVPVNDARHVFTGDPAMSLLSYIGSRKGFNQIRQATALSTGALATSEDGKRCLSINGSSVSRCKSDLVITLKSGSGETLTVGVSTKQCNNRSPTNAQLYFTTANGFTSLLQKNGIDVSQNAITALRQFCGDIGYRPVENPKVMQGRQTNPQRYFWEELNGAARTEWESLFSGKQDEISRLLFQKAYLADSFIPEYLLHQTTKAPTWGDTKVAIYSIDELIMLSRAYQRFATKSYSVKKGSHKDPVGVIHLAPRFGVIQMQRSGQKQHPSQLQFNLEAGYFYKIQ